MQIVALVYDSRMCEYANKRSAVFGFSVCEWVFTGRTDTVVFVVNVLCAEILILKIYSIYHPVKLVIPMPAKRFQSDGLACFLVSYGWLDGLRGQIFRKKV